MNSFKKNIYRTVVDSIALLRYINITYPSGNIYRFQDDYYLSTDYLYGFAGRRNSITKVPRSTGIMSELASVEPGGVGLHPYYNVAGDMFSNTFSGDIIKVTTAGVKTTQTSGLSARCTGYIAQTNGDIFFIESGSPSRVIKKTAAGTFSAVGNLPGAFPGGGTGYVSTIAPNGDMYFAGGIGGANNSLFKVTAAGAITTVATWANTTYYILDLEYHPDGYLIAGSSSSISSIPNVLLKITLSGVVTNIPYTGTGSTTDNIYGMCMGGTNLYVLFSCEAGVANWSGVLRFDNNLIQQGLLEVPKSSVDAIGHDGLSFNSSDSTLALTGTEYDVLYRIIEISGF